VTSAMIQMQPLRALIETLPTDQRATWIEAADLLYSAFDSLDNLRTQINEIKSRGGNAESPAS